MNIQNQGHYEEVKPADFWDENPTVEGELIDMVGVPKHDGTEYWKYKVRQDNGEEVEFLGGKIIDNRLRNCNVGTRVKITSLGWKTDASGFDYRDFSVEKWVNEGATASVAQAPRDSRTPDRVAAERGEVNRPQDPLNLGAGLPEEDKIDVDSIPFCRSIPWPMTKS